MSICKVRLNNFVINFEPCLAMLSPGDVMSSVNLISKMVYYANNFEPDTLNMEEIFICSRLQSLEFG